jgi:hypothetical protein
MIHCHQCEELNLSPAEYDKLCRVTPRLLLKTTTGGLAAFTKYRMSFLPYAVKVQSCTSGKAGGLKDVNRSKRLQNREPPKRWRALT